MELIPFLVLCVVVIILFSPVIIILTAARKLAKQRMVDSMKIAETYGHIIGQGKSFPIRYASEPRFVKIAKIFPWEEHGLLIVQDDRLIFHPLNNSPMEFPYTRITVTWIGTKYWPNGIIAWFAICYGNTKHYFTSDTGMWTTESYDTTKAIYDCIYEDIAKPGLHDA